MRRLLRINLADSYEIVDTGTPEQALALAMQDKPDAILLDLRMPKYSGFELCRTFNSLTFHAVDSPHRSQWRSGHKNEIAL